MHERLRFLEAYNLQHHTANVPPETGALLLFFSQLVAAQRILEIGTSTGYSALWLAQSGATVHTIERRADRATLARESFSGLSSVTLLEGDALTLIPSLAGPFDVLFLDATKCAYFSYLQTALPLLTSCALLLADNVISHREKMQDFLAFVADHYPFVILPVGGGLLAAVIRKKTA